jgi:hypothetical protein
MRRLARVEEEEMARRRKWDSDRDRTLGALIQSSAPETALELKAHLNEIVCSSRALSMAL